MSMAIIEWGMVLWRTFFIQAISVIAYTVTAVHYSMGAVWASYAVHRTSMMTLVKRSLSH